MTDLPIGTTFPFSKALHYLKEGKKLARKRWPRDTFLRLVAGDEGSRFEIREPRGLARWRPTEDDLLAEDWLLDT